MRPVRVYVSGPYTAGDVGMNVRTAILAGDELYEQGFEIYLPHLNHFHHLLRPHDWDFWLARDLCWLELCDCVLRLDGLSVGADRETTRAVELGMPVFNSIEELCYSMSRTVD